MLLSGLAAKTILSGLAAKLIFSGLAAKVVLSGLAAKTILNGLAAKVILSGMAAKTKTLLSGLAAVKHGSQDQHGPNLFFFTTHGWRGSVRETRNACFLQ